MAGEPFWLVPELGDASLRSGRLVVRAEAAPRRLARLVFGRTPADLEPFGEDGEHRTYRYTLLEDVVPGAGLLADVLHDLASFDVSPGRVRMVRHDANGFEVVLDLDEAKDGAGVALLRRRVEASAGRWRTVRVVDDLDMILERVADYGTLSEGEVETFRVAWHAGYYSRPRRCTLQDVASKLGVSKSAVAHRLRRVEETALQSFNRELQRFK